MSETTGSANGENGANGDADGSANPAASENGGGATATETENENGDSLDPAMTSMSEEDEESDGDNEYSPPVRPSPLPAALWKPSSESTSTAVGSALEEEEIDPRRLFRSEGVISDVDLRVDVAKDASRVVINDEAISLDEKSIHARGNYTITRGSRERRVHGDYERHVEYTDMYTVQHLGSIDERVEGGVSQHMKQGVDVILGGVYVNTIAGPWLRVCAWADFLAWGGWAEVDVCRVEISNASIRSHMFYAHACGARITAAAQLTDDFVARIENFGVFTDSTTAYSAIGSPGSGMTLET